MVEYIGQKIHMLPTPSAVISRPVLEKNCSRVLQAVDALSVGFRPHVKTHKVGFSFYFLLIPSDVYFKVVR